jgi:hypothetical protein
MSSATRTPPPSPPRKGRRSAREPAPAAPLRLRAEGDARRRRRPQHPRRGGDLGQPLLVGQVIDRVQKGDPLGMLVWVLVGSSSIGR